MTFADEKYLSLAALMTDMSEDLISESDIRGGVVHPDKGRRAGRFSDLMNHPAMVAVLCAVVSLGVVVAIVLAGRGGPVTPPVGETLLSGTESSEGQTEADTLAKLFEEGMTFEQVCSVLEEQGISYVYCLQRFFVSQGNAGFLMLTMDPWGPFVVKHMEQYEKKQPTNKDVYAIRSGMSANDVATLLGQPIGDFASGPITTAYETVEGDEFWLYWTQIDGEFTVTHVLQIADESDVFWIGMTAEKISEVVNQRQMEKLSCTSSLLSELMPYIVLKEDDGTVYLLELAPKATDFVLYGSVKRIYQYTDKTPTDADISAINSEEEPTFPEIIERLGMPLDYRITAGQYSGVMGFYENYYFRYITKEGREYEIVFHDSHPQMYHEGYEGGFSFNKIVMLE